MLKLAYKKNNSMQPKPSEFYNNSVFWIEVDKIKPNPFQPRREFDEIALRSLAESIRQYGVLQALVVTRREIIHPDGGLSTEYELIAGERRLRAAKLAGLSQVPALIRASEDTDLMKLELAIIENIQREDLSPVDRARAFHRLAEEFKFKQNQIAEKVGKSREYVANTIRILTLPDEILDALNQGKISEGHTRPLMMLSEKPEEQTALFKEIIDRKLTVRDSEAIARRVAVERARKRDLSPEIKALENELSETFGTRVLIEKKQIGGKILIDFFSDSDLGTILDLINAGKINLSSQGEVVQGGEEAGKLAETDTPPETEAVAPLDDRSREEKENEEIYFIKNFSV